MAEPAKRFTLHLAVADLATTAAFYGGILEQPLEQPPTARGAPEHLLLRGSDWQLVFEEVEAIGRAHPVLNEGLAGFPRGVGVTLQFRVDNLDGISDALEEEGIEILYPLELKPFGAWELWCYDPDGYLVVLVEPVR